MEKILIGLSIPAINWHMDMLVPPEAVVGQLTGLLAKSVSDLSDGRYCVSGDEMLTLQEPDLLLDSALKLSDYGVQDGDQLVLL